MEPGLALGGEQGDRVQGRREEGGPKELLQNTQGRAGQGVEDRIHTVSPREVMVLGTRGHEMRPLCLCDLWNQCHLKYFYSIWVFFLNNPTKEQITNSEIVTVPVTRKTKSTGSFAGSLVMKRSETVSALKSESESGPP